MGELICVWSDFWQHGYNICQIAKFWETNSCLVQLRGNCLLSKMISPWVSSTSSMRQNQHVWIPTVQQEYGSLVNFKLTSVTLTQINTKTNYTNSSNLQKRTIKLSRSSTECVERAYLTCTCGWMCVCACIVVYINLGVYVLFVLGFFSSKSNANYWASGSVKCTAVVTVSARWTIELLYDMTVGGVSRFHPNCPVLLLSFANVNQKVSLEARGKEDFICTYALSLWLSGKLVDPILPMCVPKIRICL